MCVCVSVWLFVDPPTPSQTQYSILKSPCLGDASRHSSFCWMPILTSEERGIAIFFGGSQGEQDVDPFP